MIETTHKAVRTGKVQIDGPVVYVIYGDDGEWAYVGQTQNANRRFRWHTASPRTGYRGSIGDLFPDGPRDYAVEIYPLKDALLLFTDYYSRESKWAFAYTKDGILCKALKGEGAWFAADFGPEPFRPLLLCAEEGAAMHFRSCQEGTRRTP